MKNLVIACSLLFSQLGIAQYLPGSEGITVTVTESMDISPDYFTLTLVLGEKFNVDPETQMAKSISIDEVLTKVAEKLKPYDMGEKDLVLVNFKESSQENALNNYGIYNYANKKKLVTKEYELKWTLGFEKMETFLTSLRFSGFDGARITPVFEKTSVEAAQNELMKLAMEKAKKNALLLAGSAGSTLGSVTGIQMYDFMMYDYGNDYMYQNYNYDQNSIYVTSNNVKSRQEKISVTVTYSIE